MRVYSVSVSLMPIPDKMLRVATGSMDEMSAPNKRDSNIGRGVRAVEMYPITTALKTVPTIANVKIGNKSRRKAFLSILNADEKMIGGSRMFRNRLLSKDRLLVTSVIVFRKKRERQRIQEPIRIVQSYGRW